jgi:hypothetical protein
VLGQGFEGFGRNLSEIEGQQSKSLFFDKNDPRLSTANSCKRHMPYIKKTEILPRDLRLV